MRDLRIGTFDVLVGINLLREGLDLPEVSLVAVLDADKEGFLRSESSLLQVAGRAARNVAGLVILYADKITNAMENLINETERRRDLQKKHNKKFGLKPKTIEKSVEEIMTSTEIANSSIDDEADFNLEDVINYDITENNSEMILLDLHKKMIEYADNLDFENAAKVRDEIEKPTKFSKGAIMNMEPKRIQKKLGIVGNSEKIQNVLEMIAQVAPVDISVMISGKSGVGKELIAKAVHFASKRSTNPLIIVNCGAIPEGIIESELFGHVKGSFTGASEDRKGYFEEANKGTIFLDEIGEMPLETQVKLLRVLESGEFMRVGEAKARYTDVRIIAATNKNLENL